MPKKIDMDLIKTMAELQANFWNQVGFKQITIAHFKWFVGLSKKRRDQLANIAKDERFKLLETITIKVPDDYNHFERLGRFRQVFESEFSSFDSRITDENFVEASTKLLPRQELQVKIFKIENGVGPDECIAFQKANNFIFAGAQGASLAWQFARKKLPTGECLSFDEKDSLGRAENDVVVPVINTWRNPFQGKSEEHIKFELSFAWHYSLINKTMMCFSLLPDKE